MIAAYIAFTIFSPGMFAAAFALICEVYRDLGTVSAVVSAAIILPLTGACLAGLFYAIGQLG